MFTLYWIVFAPAQKPYRIGILFTRKNGDFGAISVTERSCAALIPKEEHHISDRWSYLPDSLFAPAQKPYRIGILFTRKNGDFGAISVTERSCAALIPKEEHHISDRWSYLPDSLFAPAQKPYRIGILFTRKNGDFGAISVTERSSTAPRRSLKWRVTYRIGVHTIQDSLFAPTQKPYRIGILFTRKNGDFGAISVTERSSTAPRRSLKVKRHISDRGRSEDWNLVHTEFVQIFGSKIQDFFQTFFHNNNFFSRLKVAKKVTNRDLKKKPQELLPGLEIAGQISRLFQEFKTLYGPCLQTHHGQLFDMCERLVPVLYRCYSYYTLRKAIQYSMNIT